MLFALHFCICIRVRYIKYISQSFFQNTFFHINSIVFYTFFLTAYLFTCSLYHIIIYIIFAIYNNVNNSITIILIFFPEILHYHLMKIIVAFRNAHKTRPGSPVGRFISVIIYFYTWRQKNAAERILQRFRAMSNILPYFFYQSRRLFLLLKAVSSAVTGAASDSAK